jgi:hypothetical protein
VDTITCGDVAARLAALPPADVAAVRLYLELQPAADALDAETIDKRREEIEQALESLHRQVEATQGMVKRCMQLQPIPARQVPDGI